MKKGKRGQERLHHHHHLQALLRQYDHLNIEQRLLALETDILALASTTEGAYRILEKIAEKMRNAAMRAAGRSPASS